MDAKPVGDWTIVPRGDGTAQWAYKRRPAYIHAGDRPNGGERGHGHEAAWRLITF
jgi:predicted lipoprotein with Yx(FWY)xxD motif